MLYDVCIVFLRDRAIIYNKYFVVLGFSWSFFGFLTNTDHVKNTVDEVSTTWSASSNHCALRGSFRNNISAKWIVKEKEGVMIPPRGEGRGRWLEGNLMGQGFI